MPLIVYSKQESSSAGAPPALPVASEACAVQTAQKISTTSSTAGGTGGGGRGHGGRGGQEGSSGERSTRRFSFAQSFLRMASHDTRGSSSSSSQQVGAESVQGSSTQPNTDTPAGKSCTVKRNNWTIGGSSVLVELDST